MYKIRTLKNGLRLVCEKIDYVHSVSLGVRIGAGTITETPENQGISHFIEHMLFKGTATRSARDIAEFTESFGGQLNAFTARDNTFFYIKATSGHFEKCFEILSDMLLSSSFKSEEIARERGVVLEEISMYEDAPEELLYDTLDEICFMGQSIGKNILGSKKTLETFNKEKILKYMNNLYCGDNMVISAAGNFDEEEFFSLAEKYFGNVSSQKSIADTFSEPYYTKNKKVCLKDIEQAHIGMAFPGMKEGCEDIYAMSIINNILGGGMSSRLYQRIREEMGLAYSIDSSCTYFSNCGLTSVYAAVSPENEEKVIEEILKEIKKIKQGVKKSEIERAKEQTLAACVFASEEIGGRMSLMSKQLLHIGKIQPDDEYARKISSVKEEDLERILSKYFDVDMMSLAIVKPE